MPVVVGMDPWKGTVGKVESFEDGATSPMHYVIAIDNGKYLITFVIFTQQICFG